MHDEHTQHPHGPQGHGHGCGPNENNERGGRGRGRGPGRPHHRRDEFGFGPGFGGPFGRGPGGRGGRRRMRRGDVRAAILVLLSEEPRNGYQLMQEIEERSEGAWRPSPGSVYPALQQLEDEGLVKPEESEGRKQFTLTNDGAKHVEEHREKLGEPWADLGGDAKGGQHEYWKQIKPLVEAMKQVSQVGDEDAVKRGAEVLADARRKLYAILAEDRTDGEAGSS